MAARKQLWHPDEVRRKIQASQLINRLMAHINSDAPLLDSSQVTAATKLLNKVIPDLSSVTHAGPDGEDGKPTAIQITILDNPKR